MGQTKKFNIDGVISFNSDIDGVMIDGLGMIDRYVYDIDKIASDRYYKEEILASLNTLLAKKEELESLQRFNSSEMKDLIREIKYYEGLKSEHYEHKNIVLEEALPEYVNRIPYDDIYQPKNMFPGVIDTLNQIHDAGIFQEFNAPTAINPAREIVAKQKMLSIFPWLNVYGFKFFVDPFYLPGTHIKTPNRVPCDKPKKLISIKPKMDVRNSVLFDDVLYIIASAKALGFKAYHVASPDNIVDIYIEAANYIIDKVHGGKIKKLSR